MITFHVGLHKTGTSAIQSVLDRVPARSLNGACYAGTGEGLLWAEGAFDECAAKLLKRRARSQHVILSNNGLIGNIGGEEQGFVGEVYQGASSAASKIEAVYGDTAYQVIVYIRPQLEWATSFYNERIAGGFSYRPTEFVDGLIDQPNFKWTNLIRVITEAVGARNLIVRCYYPGIDVVDDFFRVLNLGEVPNSLKGTRDNVSLAPTQIAVLRNINEQAEPDLRPLIRYALQNNIEPRGLVQASPLPESAQEQLFEFFRNDWVSLADAVSGTLHADPGRFRKVALNTRFRALPYVGTDIHDSLVAAEALHILTTLLVRSSDQNSSFLSLLRRVANKLRDDPKDLPQTIRRVISRGRKKMFWRHGV